MRTVEVQSIARALKDQAAVLDAEIAERETIVKKVGEEDEDALRRESYETGGIREEKAVAAAKAKAKEWVQPTSRERGRRGFMSRGRRKGLRGRRSRSRSKKGRLKIWEAGLYISLYI